MAEQTDLSGVYRIDVDIACGQCGYNLRGLDAGGRCPECGRAVGETLVGERLDLRGLLIRADRGWLRQLVDGCCTLSLVVVLWILIDLAPESAFKRYSLGRQIVLGVMCSIWVLTGAGVWKLTSTVPHAGKSETVWRMIARISTCLFAAQPLWFAADDGGRRNGAVFEMLIGIGFFGGVVSAISLFEHLHNLARRLPSVVFQINFRLLSVFCAAGMLLSLGRRLWEFDDESSLSFVIQMPTPIGAYPIVWSRMILFDRWQYWPVADPEAWIVSLLPIWVAVALTWFTLSMAQMYLRTRKSGSSLPPDGGA